MDVWRPKFIDLARRIRSQRGTQRMLLIAAFFLAGCVPVLTPEPALQVDVADIALARHASEEMYAKFSSYPDPAVQGYVQDVGLKLAAHAPAFKNIKLRFTVLDSPGQFAYSYANGEIVIARGLLIQFNSEAQLAAVLAHEIGHVVSLHPGRQLKEIRKAQELEARLAACLATQQGREVLSTLGLARVRGYSREHEIEADVWSERLLKQAGYDVGAMAQVLRLFIQQEAYWDKQGFELWDMPDSSGGEGVFATHPSAKNRLEQATQRLGRRAVQVSVSDPAYLKRLQGMIVGLPQSYGVLRRNSYKHPVRHIAFSLPSDWYLFGSNDRLVAARRNQDGLLIIKMAARPGDETTRQALEKLAKDHSLQSVVTQQTATVKGQMAVGNINTGSEMRSARFAVLDVGDQRVQVVGFTFASKNWTETDQIFRGIMQSLRALPESEAGRVLPLKVHIEPAPADNLLARSIIEYSPERWQLLNQVYPRGDIRVGQLVKTIR